MHTRLTEKRIKVYKRFVPSLVPSRKQTVLHSASPPPWVSLSPWTQPAPGAALPRSGGNARRQGPLAVHGLWICKSFTPLTFHRHLQLHVPDLVVSLTLYHSLPKTTYKGKSSFQTYSDFLQWENFVQEQLAALPQSSALQRGFQTCEHWKQIFMEIIGK